jgi:hypothetical protein
VAIYDQARDDADRADALALTTDILLGGVLAGVAVTAIVLLTSDGSGEQESAWIAPQGAGVRVGF